MRRQVESDEISIDVVTNFLPSEKGPYYLIALGVDSTGTVCFQNIMTKLELIPEVGVYGSGDFYLDRSYVNDAVVFVITKDGYGASENDLIDNLDHPSIILFGTYLTNHN